jgi:hypothetical protein
MVLSRHQLELLEFERRLPRHTNDKINGVREFFGLSMQDYEKQLRETLALPAALAYDSKLVIKAKRQREALQWFSDRSHLVDWR